MKWVKLSLFCSSFHVVLDFCVRSMSPSMLARITCVAHVQGKMITTESDSNSTRAKEAMYPIPHERWQPRRLSQADAL